MDTKPASFSKEQDGYCIVFERILPHPVQKVWDAITRPEELKYWFTDIQYEPVEGAQMTIQFRDGARTRSYGEIVHIEPPVRFVWTWEGELAEWELTPLGPDATKLVFRYSRVDGSYALKVAAGFHSILDLLVARLAGSEAMSPFGAEADDPEGLPYRIGYAEALYDQHPECVKETPVIVQTTVRTPVSAVWAALTDREQMARWYFELDDFRPEVGFTFTFAGQGTEGETYHHLCRVTQVDHERLLQYSWQYEGYPGYSLVTFRLEAEPAGGTRVILTHFGLETFPAEVRAFARANFEAGWGELIGKLLPAYLAG